MRHGIIDESRAGRRTIVLVSPVLEAAFVPEAGMVCASLEHRGEELLGQRGGLDSWVEKGSTMGIPLLYPWANRLSSDEFGVRKRDANGLPIHGLLGARPDWTLLAVERGEDDAHLRATLNELTIEARLADDALRVTTEIRSEQPLPIAFGWHPYLTLPGVPRAEWQVELPVREQALLDERGLPTGERQPVEPIVGPLGDRAFDDLFTAHDGVFAVEGGGRRIEVALDSGYPVAQVYAPPGEDFICIEPMTAPTNALVTGGVVRTTTFEACFSVRVLE